MDGKQWPKSIERMAWQGFGLVKVTSSFSKTPGEYMASVRRAYPRAYLPWSSEEEDALVSMHLSGKTLEEISGILQRQPTALMSRISRIYVTDKVPAYLGLP